MRISDWSSDVCSSDLPMNVKNGTASRVSLLMMPNRRSGKAWNKDSGNSPISLASHPKPKPVAAKLKATGKPVSRKNISPQNISGTKLLIKNSITRSEEHTSELQSLMRISYAVFCLKKKNKKKKKTHNPY